MIPGGRISAWLCVVPVFYRKTVCRFWWFCLIIMALNAQAEVITVTNLYTTAINPLNGVHPLWTPVQHYRGRTFVVVPDLKLRPMVTQIDRDGKVTTVPLDPAKPDYTASPDGHNRFTLGIDKTGYIHIIGDMHGYAPWAGTYIARYQYQNILYWRSNRPLDVTGGFTFVGGVNHATTMPGVEWGGDSRMFNDRNGELYFSARVRAFEGGPYKYSEPFIAYGMYRYNTTNGTWAAIGGSAADAAPGAQNYNVVLYWEYTASFEAYQTQPRFDNNNRLHFSIAGNTEGTEGQGLIYAYSDDCGLTWKKASGKVIPGLPLRGKDGEANQGDLIIRDKSVAQQSSVFIDKKGKISVAGWTWTGKEWTRVEGGHGIIGPDNMLTAEHGWALGRCAEIGDPMVDHNTGFGQIFSISELALQNENAVYAVGLPRGFNFVNATNMTVFKATFGSGDNVATGGVASARSGEADAGFDGNIGRKWYSPGGTASWLQYNFGDGVKWALKGYDLTSGDDMPNRDPKNWEFQGSADGVNWTTLDTRTNEMFETRHQTRRFSYKNSTLYQYYRLNVTENGGQGEVQLAELGLSGVRIPAAPMIFKPVVDNVQVWLSWTASAFAESYIVKRGTSKAGPFTTVAKGVTSTGEYLDKGLVNGRTYYYAVSAVSSLGESPDSAPVSVQPVLPKPLPPIIYETIGQNKSAVLKWLPLWPDATGYNVKYSTENGGPYTTIGKGLKGLSCTHPGLVNDKTYYYVVSAVNPVSGESADSKQVAVKPFRWIPILKYRSIGYEDPGTASASADNPPRETAAGAFDGINNSKWLMLANKGWLQYKFADGEKWAVTRYRMMSGQDGPERDPTDWMFQASSNGTDWITLDSQTNQVFAQRNIVNTYDVTNNSTAYQYYRLDVTRNVGNGITQLAELELWADGSVLTANKQSSKRGSAASGRK